MADRATTIEEQITLLESRGMKIDDKEKAKENLLDIGYYRLGFYWFPFEKTYPRKIGRTHEFKEGTEFDDVIKLYYFDFDLRNLLLKYISRIEINFRTTLVYLASNKYKNDPFWYNDSQCVNKSFLEDNLFIDAIKEATKNEVIRQDLKSHKRKYAPAWKLMEHLSFGIVVLLYENLLDGGLKHQIAQKYKMSFSQFTSYINAIRRLRNYCAHGQVLFDVNLPVAISNGPAGDLGNRKTMLYGAYKVFKYILGQVSTNRVNDMTNELKFALSKVNNKTVKDVIYNNSGFREEDI